MARFTAKLFEQRDIFIRFINNSFGRIYLDGWPVQLSRWKTPSQCLVFQRFVLQFISPGNYKYNFHIRLENIYELISLSNWFASEYHDCVTPWRKNQILSQLKYVATVLRLSEMRIDCLLVIWSSGRMTRLEADQ